jgi:hypothetical protein
MSTPDYILMAFLWGVPILVFFTCLYLCIRRREFLGGPGSLVCFMLVISISGYASEHWRSPYQYIVIGVLVACYLWFFFIRPFRAGLK